MRKGRGRPEGPVAPFRMCSRGHAGRPADHASSATWSKRSPWNSAILQHASRGYRPPGSAPRLGDVVHARRVVAAPAAVCEDLPGLAQLNGMRGNLRSFVAAASSALTTAAYWSTYSCSESERIAYMISSVIARRTAFSLSMPS